MANCVIKVISHSTNDVACTLTVIYSLHAITLIARYLMLIIACLLSRVLYCLVKSYLNEWTLR